MSRVLALDFGLSTIGVAISDPNQTMAFARDSLPNEHSIFTVLPRMLQQEGVETLVIGRSSSIFVQQKAEEFVHMLQHLITIPVVFVDEMFTTKLANTIPLAIGMKKKDRQNFDDNSAAAAFILENYLNQSREQRAGSGDSGSTSPL